jgi:hypothetical protein
MITINLRNIEEFIFNNKEIRENFPEFKYYFHTWELAFQHPAMRHLKKEATLNLLNHLNERHVATLEEYFGTKVTIDKLNNRIVRNYQFSIEEAEEELNKAEEFANLVVYRDADQIYISVWV